MQWDADQANLLSEWQHLHLRDKCGDLDPYQRSDVLQWQLTQVEWGRSNKSVSAAAACHLFRIHGERYSSSVDSPLELGGVNNFAEGALALQAGHKNESKQWTTSLTKERLKTMKCVQDFINTSKTALESVIPPGKENAPLDLSEVETKLGVGTKPSALAAGKPLSARSSNLSSNTTDRPAEHSSSRWNLANQSVSRGAQDIQLTSVNCLTIPGVPQGRVGVKPRDRLPPGSVPGRPGAAVPDSELNQGKTSVEEHSERFTNRKSLFSGQGPANPYAAFAANNPTMPPYKKPEPAKRTFREVDNEDEDGGAIFNAFKTAKEQLAIDQQKKYGRGRGGAAGGSAGQVAPGAYGSSKRSLGTRRGLNNKFVPPVMNRDDDCDDGGTLVRKAGPRKTQSEPEEPVDERLKNIDPKMIELVTNEIMDHGPPMNWSDIAGLDFAKKTIKEIVVWPMLRPDIFTGLRGPPKGLLLFGPPGTGKTLIGKCIACQSKSTFFSISASSLTSKWVGEGEKMVRALFAVARVHQPAVIFIDEIDSLLSQRTDGEHEASRRIKTEFLVQLDGATTSSDDRILVVGATNRPQEIDEAARRRFVKRLYIPLPESAARMHIIWNLMAQQSHQLSEEDVVYICQKTDGYSGADMANLCREAALGPIRSISLDDIESISADQVRPILSGDFEKALLQVRASVSEKDLDVYLDWNKHYGSWEI